MAEQDRLAALLERATRERRGGADDDAPPSGQAADEWGSEVVDPPVSGGAWLPEDPGAGRHRPDEGRPRLFTVPESLRSVHVAVRPVAVVGVIVVVLLAGGVFGVRWWLAEQGSQPVPVAPGAGTVPPAAAPTAPDLVTEPLPVGAGAASGGGGDGAAATAVAAAQPLLVHVDGQVRVPGVVSVEPGARVLDAVAAAGGLTGDADTSRLNLARPLTDGERLWVPRPGEEIPDVADGASGGGKTGPAGLVAAAARPVNINTAGQAELEELPGVGPVTAGAIVQWRTEHGRFSSPDELLEVSGIGEATLEKLRPHVTL
jgi:competence protein ComEA